MAGIDNVLRAKEQRHKLFRAFTASDRPVVTCNLNLPGGSGAYPWAEELLRKAVEAINQAFGARGFRPGFSDIFKDDAGIYWLGTYGDPIQYDVHDLKQVAISIEDGHPLGRLWDIDVLAKDAQPISRMHLGLAPRSCFVCPEPAHECRVAGRHSRDEVVRSAERTWCREVVSRIEQSATAGMLLEAAAWPSPGLVSPRSQGAHSDMNYLTFLLGSSALAGGFGDLAEVGVMAAVDRLSVDSLASLLPGLRTLGMALENKMFVQTGGVNTQKGLLFIMGLVACSAGFVGARLALEGSSLSIPPKDVATIVGKICSGLSDRELRPIGAGEPGFPKPTRGQQVFLKAGLRGIRGEAENGLPTVMDYGLPAFGEAIDKVGLQDALVQALLAIMSQCEDTSVAGRHSPDALTKIVWPMARAALRTGGVYTPEGRGLILEMERRFSQERLNPGGSADLLAVTACLYMCEHGRFSREQVMKGSKWV